MFNDVNLLSFNANTKEKYTTLLMEKLFTVEERYEGCYLLLLVLFVYH